MNFKTLVRYRAISQIVFFIFLVIFVTGAICAFSLGGNQVFTCTLGMLQITLASQTIIWGVLASGLVLVFLTLVLGRVFCSWVCPFGSLLDWLQKILGKVKTKNKYSACNDNLLTHKRNKYGILAGVLISAGVLRSPVFCTICPIGGTCRAAGVQGMALGLEAALIPLIASLEIFRRRFWCKFLCPVGAVIAITDKLSFMKITLPAEKCLRCGRCNSVCNMDVKPWDATHKKLTHDPLVLDALMSHGLPDVLNRPVPFGSLPSTLQNTLTQESKKFPVTKGECIRCYECTAICPLLNQATTSHDTKSSNKPLPA